MNNLTAKSNSTNRIVDDNEERMISSEMEPRGEVMESIGEAMGRDLSSGSSLREINISPLNSGFMVRVGCQTVAVEKSETLITMLTKYLNNPSEFEKKWYSKNVINRLENID